MDAGASIGELNTVRKHLSALKGGRLAQVAPAPIVSLVLSDVVGDDLAVVGGGLTVPDPSTFGEAASVCRRRGVWSRLPEAVQRHLAAGAEGGPGAPGETPKPGNAALARARAVRVAGPNPLAAAAAETLGARGFLIERVMTGVSSPVEALAAELAANAVALAFRIAPGERRAIVFGGEPTVALPGASGRGGRAQHVAWQVAVSMAQMPWPGEGAVEVAVLAAGSDGNDGPTADAGGVVDPHSAARARAAGVDPSRALAEFDSGTALAAAGDLVTTGPTGTNLCDLFLIGATRR
jgi:glycerate-2-kinase